MIKFPKNRLNLILAAALAVLLIGGFWGFQALKDRRSQPQQTEEVDLTFDPQGPYALLIPRKDGNALSLNLKRTASYEAISYELAYVSHNAGSNGSPDEGGEAQSGNEGIDRGVVGNVNTAGKRGEYTQEILFGTCSKNVCKYDSGVENGTLTLHITKGNKRYRMVTLWHIQRPDLSHGLITSGDGHFSYLTSASQEELANTAYTIVNDLPGVPKLPADKKVFGKVYALNVPAAKSLPAGTVKLESRENPPADAKVAVYLEQNNEWKQLETKVEGGKLTAKADSPGIFAILVNSK